ncbi:leucine-rich repeat-containing protein 14-like [Ostrea edulis]|uniref:leucine-rich repeat-containing protein 14-like n=1 Tax=Ostrea edulis TaxID=37623 RepID=UPI0024AEA580|nr:leucine-rich repeat-containing protein 14-like [Ostrea edulis]
MMQTTLWYDNYQGAVYPLDLHAPPAIGRFNRKSSSSLVEICSKYIVRDSSLTLHTVHCVPKEVRVCLMKEALKDNKDRAIEVLISNWHMESLVLRDLTPNLFTSLQPLHDTYYLSDIVRQGLRYTTCLAHTFLECVKKKMPTKLRFLDMSGYPTAEVILYYLATHCMLAHNEARQTAMVNMYNTAIQYLPTNRASMHADNSLPESVLVIKLDAFVTSDQTHAELCKALKVSGFPESKLRLCIEKLDATCLGEPKITIMLKQIDKMILKGIRLKYNSLTCDEFMKMEPELRKFQNLTALDLSCNTIHLYQNDTVCERMSETLASLPQLTRLDLSNNRIKNRLRLILQQMNQSLRYLRLCGCGLTNLDLTYLAHSHHTSGLQELDISENTLSTCAISLGQLFSSAGPSLCVFEAEETKLNDEVWFTLIHHMLSLEKLLYMNLAENNFSANTLQCFMQVFASLPEVTCVRIPYCRECYHLDENTTDDQISMRKMQFIVDLYSVADQVRGQQKDRLKIVANDLSRIDMDHI